MENQNLKVVRGDTDPIVVTCSGDYTGYSALYAWKASREITADRLLEKTSVASQITIEYDEENDQTTFTITREAIDTQDIIQSTLFHEVQCSTGNKVLTPVGGIVSLIGDVITPFDGFDLPSNATRFQQVDATNAGNLELNIVKTINGVKKYEFISLTELAGYLKPILDNL